MTKKITATEIGTELRDKEVLERLHKQIEKHLEMDWERSLIYVYPQYKVYQTYNRDLELTGGGDLQHLIDALIKLK